MFHTLQPDPSRPASFRVVGLVSLSQLATDQAAAAGFHNTQTSLCNPHSTSESIAASTKRPVPYYTTYLVANVLSIEVLPRLPGSEPNRTGFPFLTVPPGQAGQTKSPFSEANRRRLPFSLLIIRYIFPQSNWDLRQPYARRVLDCPVSLSASNRRAHSRSSFDVFASTSPQPSNYIKTRRFAEPVHLGSLTVSQLRSCTPHSLTALIVRQSILLLSHLLVSWPPPPKCHT